MFPGRGGHSGITNSSLSKLIPARRGQMAKGQLGRTGPPRGGAAQARLERFPWIRTHSRTDHTGSSHRNLEFHFTPSLCPGILRAGGASGDPPSMWEHPTAPQPQECSIHASQVLLPATTAQPLEKSMGHSQSLEMFLLTLSTGSAHSIGGHSQVERVGMCGMSTGAARGGTASPTSTLQ